MRYKLLGKSGLRVSELCLGTMTFGEDWGWGASPEESRRIFDAYVSAGGNFIDTAVNYTNGSAERIVGECISSRRDAFVVATKFTLRDGNANPQDPNAGGNQRKNMMRAVENSLRNLKTDYIDLYYLHIWDWMTPIEEIMRGLDDLVRSGKVLYVGVSDSPAWMIAKANTLAELRGWSRFVALQIPYSLRDRDPERELLPMARAEDMAVCAWGILGAGLLTGKFRDPKAVTRWQGATEKQMAVGDAVAELAKAYGRSPAQVAINWVRQRPRSGAPIIPILGARRLDQIEDNLGSLDFSLTSEQIASLDEIAGFNPGFPLSFASSDEVHSLVFGQTFDQTDNHRSIL